MGTMERILRLMAEKKASDVYLSAHAPAMIKINGQMPADQQPAAAAGRARARCWPRCCPPTAWRNWTQPAS